VIVSDAQTLIAATPFPVFPNAFSLSLHQEEIERQALKNRALLELG